MISSCRCVQEKPFSQKLTYLISAGSKEKKIKMHCVSPFFNCRVFVLCHSCVSIRFISQSGLLSISVHSDSGKGGWALVTRRGL